MSNLRKLKDEYKPETCDCCGQTKTYLLPIDKGTTDILRSIAVAIYRKGINVIHPRKEMENIGVPHDLLIKEGMLTSNQVGNLSRPRFHGLIAHVKDNPGNYCLTTKGADFLKGKEVPRFAIISKTTGHQEGYYLPEEYGAKITDFLGEGEYWEGINFDIVEGRIVKDLPVKKDEPAQQNNLFG